jgi:hypothetical protein
MIASSLVAPFIAQITEQLKRSDPRLAVTQMVCGTVLLLEVLLAVILLAVATFRQDAPLR